MLELSVLTYFPAKFFYSLFISQKWVRKGKKSEFMFIEDNRGGCQSKVIFRTGFKGCLLVAMLKFRLIQMQTVASEKFFFIKFSWYVNSRCISLLGGFFGLNLLYRLYVSVNAGCGLRILKMNGKLAVVFMSFFNDGISCRFLIFFSSALGSVRGAQTLC